ncbi:MULTISPECIES: hypothetical protein [unclassified Mesorhizobium]|uniref:GTP pyrophosphokinase n=1 Tax=unclassified Mesorhizobium TaxID=325217 RepID=UPI0013DFC17F|nr:MULTISPECIES: hypothetical protein [unclassified Mesorhizobium]
MSDYSHALRLAYEAVHGTYLQFTDRNEALLRELLEEGKDFHTIESRTKEIDSFEEKVDLPEKEQKYKNFSEVTDLSGLRIICYLNEDADRVCGRLAEIYSIDQEHSINKQEQLEPDQFGYRSRHFVVTYKPERAGLPENMRFAGLRAEIQVRTILQHAWAAIDWKLRYKNSRETPQNLRRRVFRVSALLELADDEFSDLSDAVQKLRHEYEQKIEAGDFKIGIDRESIDLFLNKDEDLIKIIELAKKNGFAIAPNHPRARDPYGGFISATQFAGLSAVDELKALISKLGMKKGPSFSDVFGEWKAPDRPARLVMSKAGLARLALVLALDKKKALDLVAELPFGEKLQHAVTTVLAK